MSPTKKTATTKWLKKAQTKKAMVHARLPELMPVERGHDLGAGLAHQLRDGNDGISAVAQGLDEDG